MARPRRTKIEVNSKKSLTELMQETYNDANRQISQAQRVVNQLEASENSETEADAIARINKEKINALKAKDSAIRIKTDLARLQSEIIKHDGNEMSALNEAEKGKLSETDFKSLREEIEKAKGNVNNDESENEE